MLILLFAIASATASIPLFKQCDPRWADAMMGVDGQGERATVCKEGCAMTSLTMSLAGMGFHVDPRTLNAWLVANDGYTCAANDCNNLVLDSVERYLLQMGSTAAQRGALSLVGEGPKPSFEQLAAQTAMASSVFIAHVRNSSHFVLVTGTQGEETLIVNDPYYNQSSYPYVDVSDIIMYDRMAAMPRLYPLFKQCNASWGNDVMVNTTVCAVGCLLSSISMAMSGFNVPIEHQLATPHTLNAWLRTHNGYDSNNDLREETLPRIDPRIKWPADGMHRTNDLPLATIRSYVDAGRVVIANVHQGRHFVLVVGYPGEGGNSSDMLYVHDPGFTTGQYSYTHDIVGWRLFDIAD